MTMRKRFLIAALCAAVIFTFSSCKSTSSQPKTDNTSAATTTEQQSSNLNPLTGLENLDPAASGKRPVAIMINNIKAAWSVQTGLNKADIIYETQVEAGITRYLAVFQDINNAPSYIGTVRSARYTYAELALGHDAIYVHCGIDERYTHPFMKNMGMDDLDLGSNAGSAGFRVKNGKATEHTLYTSGEKISKTISKLKIRTDIKDSKNKPYFNFNSVDSPVKPELSALNAKVVFSKDYYSEFKYDSASGMYLKSQGGKEQRDYRTGKQVKVKNVIVLYTPIKPFNDDYHVKASLSSGKGYYLSEGGYTPIKWSKGSSTNPLSLSKEDGSPLSVNAGTSWICIAPTEFESSFTVS